MNFQAQGLRYSVRLSVLLKYLGQYMVLLSTLTLVPLVVSLLYRENSGAWHYGVLVGALALLGLLFNRIRVPGRVQPNEAMVLVALFFLMAPLLMTYPFMAEGLKFSDAFFEAVSAVTTTGLSTLPTRAGLPHAFLFSRAWMQWYGGLGIMVLSLALLVPAGIAAKSLSATEAESEDLVGGTKILARKTLKIYVLMTFVGWLGLWLMGNRKFSSLLYIFASVSTGGFSPLDGSLQGLHSVYSQWWVLLFCILCAVPLIFYYQIFQKQQISPLAKLQFKTLILLGLLSTACLIFFQWLHHRFSYPMALHHLPLLAYSAQTTTGFSSFKLDDLDSASKIVLILSMMVGGGVGSTAGGFKILRLLIFFSLLRTLVFRTSLSTKAVIQPHLQKRILSDEEISEPLMLMILFVGMILFSWIPFLVFGYDPVDSLFEVTSAMGTVGLSTGITQIKLPGLLKGILCADMLLGRLEIFAWLVILYPQTWIGRRMKTEAK